MDEFIKEIVKKTRLLFLISRKMLDAIIEKQEGRYYNLLDDYKRIYDGLEKLVYSQKNIDIEEASKLIDYRTEKLYGDSSPISNCSKGLLYNLIEKSKTDEETFNATRSILEELINIEYTIRVENYKKLNDSEKNYMFNYLATSIMNSTSLQELYRGNSEKSEKLSNPNNYFDDYEISIMLEILLKGNLITHFTEVSSLVTLENYYKVSREYSKSNQVEEMLNMAFLDEKISIAAIYAEARERNVDVSLENFDLDNRSIDIVKEAAEMGENYLKKYYKNYQKIKLK